MQNTSTFKPKIWVAALLAIIAPPSALLYVGRLRAALTYLLVGIVLIYSLTIYVTDESTKAFTGFFYAFLCGAHAYYIAVHFPDGVERPIYGRWYSIAGFILMMFSITFGIRAFGFESFRINSNSMSPSLVQGDTVILKKWGYGHYSAFGINLLSTRMTTPIKHGDVVIFEFPPDRRLTYLQRVVGVPGDLIEYKDKALHINGTAITTVKIDSKTAAVSADGDFEIYEEVIGDQKFQTMRYTQAPSMAIMSPVFRFADNCQYSPNGFKCKVPNEHYFSLGDNRDDSLDSRYWGFIPEDHILGVVSSIVR